MNILIAPDKFKGTFRAEEIATLLARELSREAPDLSISQLPMADGGDGTAELLARHHQARRHTTKVLDPLGRPHTAGWGFLPSVKTAFLDMASASGLRHLQPEEYNPLITSTYGTGELLKAALEDGAETIYLGVGGSATNDGGCGALAALGFRFLNQEGNPFLPTGGSLHQLKEIVPPQYPFTAQLNLLCDVDTPFAGPLGASHTFAMQKGATRQEVEILEKGMLHLARCWQQFRDYNLTFMPYAGAAGGLAGGLFCGLGARLLSGAATFSQLVGLQQLLASAQLLISGEGQLDASSLQGKVVGFLARECRNYKLPLWVVCGQNTLSEEQLKLAGIGQVFPLYQEPPKDYSASESRLKALVPRLLTQIKKASIQDAS